MAKATIEFIVTGQIEVSLPKDLSLVDRVELEKWGKRVIDDTSDGELFKYISFDGKGDVSSFLDETPEVEEIYVDGKELIVYRSFDVKRRATEFTLSYFFSYYPESGFGMLASFNLSKDGFVAKPMFESFSDDDMKAAVSEMYSGLCEAFKGER